MDSCIISFNLNCIIQLKRVYNIATKVAEKSATTFGDLPDCLYIFIQENAFENVVRKLTAILSRPQGVKVVVDKGFLSFIMTTASKNFTAEMTNIYSKICNLREFCLHNYIWTIWKRYVVTFFFTLLTTNGTLFRCIIDSWHIAIRPFNQPLLGRHMQKFERNVHLKSQYL